ncbi:multicopper oxidase family protein [Kibdelosporangium persicum]|uniref:multicopper oxidase family protein n=1 Tax=Kibdelosporangium persicum TaxID=2698649 RepID=UPI0024844CEC
MGDRLAYSGRVPGPLLRWREGERVRLPFRNGLDVPTSLHIHGLPLSPDVDAPLRHLALAEADHRAFHLVATDGGLVEHPVEVTEILLTPGERAEILVDATTAGRLELRALPYSVYGPNGTVSEDRLLASLNVPSGLAPVALPGALRTIEPPTPAVRTRRLVLNGDGGSVFTIDGRTFDHDRVDIRVRSGTTEVWELVNDHTMDHPFHLHSYGAGPAPVRVKSWLAAWPATRGLPRDCPRHDGKPGEVPGPCTFRQKLPGQRR